MQRILRKYHRLLALILALPLSLTVLSGVLFNLGTSWLPHDGRILSLLMKVHTGSIFRLGAVYPALTGLGVIGLLITGLSLSRGGKRSPQGD